ncbi:MAG: hypothetical protein OEM99_10085 [Gammaproteobacteria bacterium]|nr:hypothetical protein [Gammaproteobacteria bacterium]
MTIVRIYLLAFVCFGIVAVANSAEKGDTGIAPTAANTESSKLLAAIQSQQELIESLQRQRTRDMMELERARADQPQKPKREGWEDPEEFQAKMTKHRAAVQAAEHDLVDAQKAVKARDKTIYRERTKLAKLQSQLPAARKHDEEERRRVLERERQGLKSKKP